MNTEVIKEAVASLEAENDNTTLRTLPEIIGASGWEPFARVSEKWGTNFYLQARFASWEGADRAGKALTKLAQEPVNDAEYAKVKLFEARAIISALLLVLHDHSGSKVRIANQARQFLGLKPGARVGTFDDKMEVMYGRR